MPHPSPRVDSDPRPTDPPFLFVMLIAARKSGDRMLESLAQDWLAEIGIRVVFADALGAPINPKRGISGVSVAPKKDADGTEGGRRHG